MRVDDIIESRLRNAARSRQQTVMIDALREGILDYIVTTAFEHDIPRSEVQCPPIERWGVRPLPEPERLRLYSDIAHASLGDCVQYEFAAVQASLSPTAPIEGERG